VSPRQIKSHCTFELVQSLAAVNVALFPQGGDLNHCLVTIVSGCGENTSFGSYLSRRFSKAFNQHTTIQIGGVYPLECQDGVKVAKLPSAAMQALKRFRSIALEA